MSEWYSLVCSQCGDVMGASRQDADEVLCPGCEVKNQGTVQEIIEGLVQWDAFQEIWDESTPREKEYVRNLLGRLKP